ncbi:hypothetical protein BJX66DRAFT_30221 [Aspergillus keveii]|uniref:Uncharacterized protein n=1 Tax=Aspergillus keveii TaxID=714993 RepID=A0ABR4FTI8_9EURO
MYFGTEQTGNFGLSAAMVRSRASWSSLRYLEIFHGISASVFGLFLSLAVFSRFASASLTFTPSLLSPFISVHTRLMGVRLFDRRFRRPPSAPRPYLPLQYNILDQVAVAAVFQPQNQTR